MSEVAFTGGALAMALNKLKLAWMGIVPTIKGIHTEKSK